MTQEEILKKAIEKAVKNGWVFESDVLEFEYHKVYFDHDFAKALGYKLKDLGEWCDKEKEPIKYLEKFI